MVTRTKRKSMCAVGDTNMPIYMYMYIIQFCVTLQCVQMVMKNLQYYNVLLLSGTPIFVVGVLLSPPEVSLHPHASELFKIMKQAMMDVVERFVSL